MSAMTRAAELRERAQKVRALAASTRNVDAKRTMLNVADTYETLAARVDAPVRPSEPAKSLEWDALPRVAW